MRGFRAQPSACGIAIGALAVCLWAAAAAAPAPAQAFADLGRGLEDYSKAVVEAAGDCGSLTGFQSGELVRMAVSEVPPADGVPALCRVRGRLDPEIEFEVSLPRGWNGRFYMIGNGGHAGEALEDPMRTSQRDAALRVGFAVAQTNAGHDAGEEPGATFVLSDPRKAVDYAYRAVHLTAVTAKAVIAAYYGRPAAYAYWNSCSNGGRQGLIEAQRYPEDFDGIVANAPWLDQTGFTLGAMWNQKALQAAPVTAEKMALVAESVLAKCDAVDGLRDGLVDDPRNCDFSPVRDVPSCGGGPDAPDCLTEAQADAVAKVYGGPESNGRPLFPGFMPGSEAVMPLLVGGGSGSGWMHTIVGALPGSKPADFSLAENTMRYLVFSPPDPDYDCGTFDFDRDLYLLERWSRLADAKDPDLGRFRQRGGKLLMTFGWADSVLQPMTGVRYYERAAAANGPGTADFFRLFMVPGMAHCSGGTGPDLFDPMTAVIDWVERGRAPESIVARQEENGRLVRSRPLCPYPRVARIAGEGSPDDAGSFRCVEP